MILEDYPSNISLLTRSLKYLRNLKPMKWNSNQK